MPRAPCVRHDTSVADQGEAALALSRAPAVRQSWLWNDDKGLVLAVRSGKTMETWNYVCHIQKNELTL